MHRDIFLRFLLCVVVLGSMSSLSYDPVDYELEDFTLLSPFKLKTIHELYLNNNLELFRTIVESYSLNVNEDIGHGFSLVHLAAIKGQIHWLALLNSLGAFMDKPDNIRHWRPIEWALFSHQVSAYRLLHNFGLCPGIARAHD